ncbi:MAG: CBS domain-containing protein [Lacipirellulaceae bacterium]
MLVCPSCGADDLIEGVEACDHCEQPLTDLFIRVANRSVEWRLLRDTVGSLPAHPPVEVSPETSIAEALRQMMGAKIGCVIVVDRSAGDPGQMVGLFSERDALRRLGAEAQTKLAEPISRYMSPNPARIDGAARIAFALHRMDIGGYRHLPVMEGERVVSVVSIRDILRYLTQVSPAPP